jgi:hypothetical protein
VPQWPLIRWAVLFTHRFLSGERHFRRRSSGMHTAYVCSWWQTLREKLSAPSHVRPDTTYDQKFTTRYRNIVNNPVRCSQSHWCSWLGGVNRTELSGQLKPLLSLWHAYFIFRIFQRPVKKYKIISKKIKGMNVYF